MVNWFLRAKPWQLFMLTFGIPLFFQIVLIIMASSNFMQAGQDTEALFDYFKIFPVIMLVFLGTFMGWFWSVANGLHALIPDGAKPKLIKFRFFFFVPVVYMLLFAAVFIGASYSTGPPPALFLLIFPFHLFSMFCMFYNLYFVAKTMRSVELQRPVTFSDFVGEFFLIWFFPIGIWFIPPRINRLVNTYAQEI